MPFVKAESLAKIGRRGGERKAPPGVGMEISTPQVARWLIQSLIQAVTQFSPVKYFRCIPAFSINRAQNVSGLTARNESRSPRKKSAPADVPENPRADNAGEPPKSSRYLPVTCKKALDK